MANHFFHQFKNKSNKELVIILNDGSFQESARTAARKLLLERGEDKLLDTIRVNFNDWTLDQLLDNLYTYKINVDKGSDKICIYTNQRNLLTGMVFYAIGLLLSVAFIFNLFFDLAPGGMKYYASYYLPIGAIACLVLGWSRMNSSQYSYFTISKNKLLLKKMKESILVKREVDKNSFLGFQVRDFRNSISIYLKTTDKNLVSIIKLKKNEFESTIDFATALADKLTLQIQG